MKFRNISISNGFRTSVTSKVCYIYKVDKDDGALSKVYYYRFENDKFVTKYANVQWFATRLILNEYVAYCGRVSNETLTNVAKVLPMVKDGKPYLTTMVDDTDTNNLIALSDYYK